jgi:hypothetical protein
MALGIQQNTDTISAPETGRWSYRGPLAMVMPVICYLYILLFAAKGQPKQRVASPAPTD